MPFGIGHWELIIVAVVLVLLFGGRQLPSLGRRLGLGVREMKSAIEDIDPRTPLRELESGTRERDSEHQKNP